MIDKQFTISRPVEIAGNGLFLGEPVHLRCLPADPDTGVVFVRTDLPGQPRIPATLANVPAPQRWTALRNGNAEVRMVEHLLAACCGLGIDNLIIETNSAEMPVGDGSARTFVESFLNAGTNAQKAKGIARTLNRALVIGDKDALICAAPQESGLTLTYVLDYGQHFVKAQTYTATITRETFISEIAPARTYVLRPEIDSFTKLGLGRGATPENTLVLEEDGRIQGQLRFADECARHKVLDMLGDMFLAGCPASARVLGYKSGHATNVQLAKALAESYAQRS